MTILLVVSPDLCALVGSARASSLHRSSQRRRPRSPRSTTPSSAATTRRDARDRRSARDSGTRRGRSPTSRRPRSADRSSASWIAACEVINAGRGRRRRHSGHRRSAGRRRARSSRRSSRASPTCSRRRPPSTLRAAFAGHARTRPERRRTSPTLVTDAAEAADVHVDPRFGTCDPPSRRSVIAARRRTATATDAGDGAGRPHRRCTGTVDRRVTGRDRRRRSRARAASTRHRRDARGDRRAPAPLPAHRRAIRRPSLGGADRDDVRRLYEHGRHVRRRLRRDRRPARRRGHRARRDPVRRARLAARARAHGARPA